MHNRLKNSVFNLQYAILLKNIKLIFGFVTRTIFIYTLGKEYVGVNGVFSDVLSLLSISELGIGSAIIYTFYKPIHDGDVYHITQLFKFFEKIYYIIGGFIFLAGLIIYPFISVVIHDVPNVEHLNLIYILTLIGSVSTYFFAQYSTIIDVHQKQGIVSKYNLLSCILMMPLKWLSLIVLHSYIVYLLLIICENIVVNFLLRRKALQLFPYIKNDVNKLDIKEVRTIFNNVKSTGSMRAATMILDSSDNIIISYLIGTTVVGAYSTYIMIIMAVQGLIYTIKDASLSSLGNLCTSDDYKKRQNIFDKLQFLFNFVNGYAVMGMILFISPFVELWAGSDYVLPFNVVVAMVFVYYLRALQWPVEAFVYADGLFRYFRFIIWGTSILNIVISIMLGGCWGVIGIVLGTILAKLFTTFWYQIYVVNKYSLKSSLYLYWRKVLSFLCFIVIECIIGYELCSFYGFRNDFRFLGTMIPISLGIYLFSFFCMYRKTDEFSFFYQLVFSYYKKLKNIYSFWI